MLYLENYVSPFGKILLASESDITSEKECLCGLWFEGIKNLDIFNRKDIVFEKNTALEKARYWLDMYFSGCVPDIDVPLKFSGSEFQNEVWQILCSIPYGETVTYGEIAKAVAKHRGLNRMSPQAVGGAVGKNPVSIIVPCHRVIGSDGSLTGYGWGIDMKIKLLEFEGIKIQKK